MRKRVVLLLLTVSLVAFAQRRDYLSHYTWQPGGTTEERMWQVPILFGVAQAGEAAWDGSLRVDRGEILGLEGYRFEPPDRVMPEGGWGVMVRPEVMETGEIIDAVGGSAVETVVMPKGCATNPWKLRRHVSGIPSSRRSGPTGESSAGR